MFKAHSPTFLFVRHGQTDHNVHKIYDDITDVPLNEVGIQQSIALGKKFQNLHVDTVISSPLLRVQETKKRILKNRSFNDLIFEEFKECPSALWRLFMAWEKRTLTLQEWEQIDQFTCRVKLGLQRAMQHEGTVLIIAHGGTFWALAHLLQLEIDRKIDNCMPVKFSSDMNSKWKVEFI